VKNKNVPHTSKYRCGPVFASQFTHLKQTLLKQLYNHFFVPTSMFNGLLKETGLSVP